MDLDSYLRKQTTYKISAGLAATIKALFDPKSAQSRIFLASTMSAESKQCKSQAEFDLSKLAGTATSNGAPNFLQATAKALKEELSWRTYNEALFQKMSQTQELYRFAKISKGSPGCSQYSVTEDCDFEKPTEMLELEIALDLKTAAGDMHGEPGDFLERRGPGDYAIVERASIKEGYKGADEPSQSILEAIKAHMIDISPTKPH